MKYGQRKLLLKVGNVENTPKTEDYGKGVATIGGAAASGAAMTKFLPMNSSFAKTHPTLRGALYAGGLSAGGLLTRAGVDAFRSVNSGAPKEASDMPPFLSQDRPEKVKEIYRALKREHPEYSAGKKARIANAMGKEAEVEYHGKKFPGYNQPIDSDRPEKKKMVLAKKGDQVKLIHFGQKGYKHNYSDAAKKNYLTRSAGIRGKDGNLTANDKFSANYWARRELWPKNEPADGSARNREKRASDVSIPEGGLRPGLLMNDLTQVMTPEDAQLVRDRLPFYERSGPGLLPVAAIGAGSGALLGHSRGAVAGGLLLPAIAYYGSASGKYDQQALQAARAAIEKAREKRASDDDFGHKAELAGLGILAAPYAAHLGAKVPGLRRAAGPVSELLHKNHSIEHAVELGGLGVLAAPSLKHYIDKRKQAKKE
jgi:hypothetical protein